MAEPDDHELHDVHSTLDLALRVGEMLLSNGAGAADVTATMDSIVRHLGLRGVMVDVTFTTLTLGFQRHHDEPAYSRTRSVIHRETDLDDLTLADQLVSALLHDQITREEARSWLAQISSTGHRTPRWAISLSWGVIGAGIAAVIGGDWIVCVIAFIAATMLELLQRALSRRRLPVFYQQIAGALVATSLSMGIAATHIPLNPSLVVTASIVMLLAGLGFIGAIQDALTGFYITAGARLLEVMLATVGIIVGVSAGLAAAGTLGVDIAFNPGVTGLSQLPTLVAGAAVSAAAFAFSAYAPYRSLLPIAVIGGLAAAVFSVVTLQDVSRAWAAAIAAIGIGIVSYTVAGWARVPPLVVIVPTIVPLLPGLSIYRGLSLIADGDIDGILAMVTAGGVAIALASGVILGEYIVQPLRREGRRLEQRLSGPRLVGPLRLPRRRRRRTG